MRVLIIGSGGREHAIGWKVKQSPAVSQLYFAPGNGGTAALGINVPIEAKEVDQLADFAQTHAIDLTVVGPEVPLQLGIADTFRARGLAIFGPDKKSAALESSKAYGKWFMQKYGIPTAAYHTFDDHASALQALESQVYPLWIKADGLAAGKGAVYCPDEQSAREALDAMMRDKIFGESGARVVMEENLEGPEVTLLCFTDGQTIVPMESATDYKRAFDGDLGANTGGMGCLSPAPHYTPGAGDVIARKTLAGIQAEGLDFRGVLYIGLMMTPAGPKVIEYNARFGDPETEALLLRLDTDLLSVFCAVEQRKLHTVDIRWKPEPAVCVVVASGGYPDAYKTGYPITMPACLDTDAVIFHAGTKPGETPDICLTNGGRVLAATALGANLAAARTAVYRLVAQIHFTDCFYRKDIAR